MDAIMGSNTLLDILGTLIGFSTIMLLLSLIVTSLVQMIQSLLQTRAKNLAKGIAAALEDAKIENSDALKMARKLLVKPTSVKRKNLDEVPGYFDNVSWIEPDELLDRLKAVVPEDSVKTLVPAFEKKFESLQRFMSRQFALRSRVVSVICAAIVAVLLQVNALDLLRELSVNPELRARYVAGSESVLATAEGASIELLSYQEVSDLALSQLGAQNPGIDTVLDEVSGIGTSRDAIANELHDVLTAALPNRAEELTEQYKDILDDLYSNQADKALELARKSTEHLAYFNLDIMPYGGKYYGKPGKWPGLLITIMFVSLGSPFWFRRLRFLAGLRDALKPKEEEDDHKPKR